jgi:D-amino-acid oxidase
MLEEYIADITRAGANFSGISGGDANALRWDRTGYSLMMRLIDTRAAEAKYLAKTESTEYWDEMPAADKIRSMTEYLREVRFQPPLQVMNAINDEC